MKAPGWVCALPPERLPEAMALVWKVFRQFEAPEYSRGGIREFQRYIALEAMEKRLRQKELSMWACLREEKLIGVLAASRREHGPHIHLLFVDQAYHRQGVARALLGAMLAFFQSGKEAGPFDVVTVNSSPFAVEAYRHLGFRATQEPQTVNGIRFVPMKREKIGAF